MNIKMKNKLTSIIINTRNGHKTINRAIRSALCQDYNSIEVIVYDNASNPPIDTVLEVKSSKLKLFRSDSKFNLGEARNKAFNLSSGHYIVYLDDDDIMLSDKVSICCNAINNLDDVGVIYTNVYVYQQEIKRGYLEYRKSMPEGNIYNLLTHGNFILWQSTFFRRDAVSSKGEPFPSKFNNITDYALYLTIAPNWKFKYIDRPLSVYVLHGENYSIRNNRAYEELIELSNSLNFSDGERRSIVDYALRKKVSQLLEAKKYKESFFTIFSIKSNKVKLRLLMAYLLSFIVDIQLIRVLLIRTKRNKLSEIKYIISLYESN